MSEVEFVKDVLIGLMILDFALMIFTAATLRSLPIGNPSLQELNTTMKDINTAGQSLGKSWCTDAQATGSVTSNHIVSNPCQIKGSDFFGAGSILNAVWGFLGFLKNLFMLILTDGLGILKIVFVIIPGLLSTSGLGDAFGTFCGYFFAVVSGVMGFYFLYVISAMLGIRKG